MNYNMFGGYRYVMPMYSASASPFFSCITQYPMFNSNVQPFVSSCYSEPFGSSFMPGQMYPQTVPTFGCYTSSSSNLIGNIYNFGITLNLVSMIASMLGFSQQAAPQPHQTYRIQPNPAEQQASQNSPAQAQSAQSNPNPTPVTSQTSSPAKDTMTKSEKQQSQTSQATKSANKVKVIVEGDSLSNGYAGKLGKLLGSEASVKNLAKDSDTLIRAIEPQIQSVIKEYDPNRKNVVVLTAGTNDLHHGKKAETVYEHLKSTVKQLKDKGFEVFVGTSIKVGSKHASEKEIIERDKYNNLIRNTSKAPWDGVIDLASMPQFDAKPESKVTDDKSIYTSEELHLTEKGYGIMAEGVRKGLEAKI